MEVYNHYQLTKTVNFLTKQLTH